MADLILALYEDKSIVTQSRTANQDNSKWPSINLAAHKIAQVVNDQNVVNLPLLKYKLLDTWLPDKSCGSGGSNLDETVTNFNIFQSLKSQLKQEPGQDKDDNEDNYWRCVYILQVSGQFKRCMQIAVLSRSNSDHARHGAMWAESKRSFVM
jgi:hypothetical protein